MEKMFQKALDFIQAEYDDAGRVLDAIAALILRGVKLNRVLDEERHAALTAWIAQLRKKDMLDSADAAKVVCSWIEASSRVVESRSNAISEGLSAGLQQVLPLLIQTMAANGKLGAMFGDEGKEGQDDGSDIPKP